MAQAPAAIFKIPTESPQLARGRASSARKAAGAQPKAASRVLGIETRAATRGGGEVIELDLGITVYPPRQDGGRWRAVWHEEGKRQQCESVSEEKLAAKPASGLVQISPGPRRDRLALSAGVQATTRLFVPVAPGVALFAPMRLSVRS